MMNIVDILDQYPNLNDFIKVSRQYSKENKLNPIDKEIVDDFYFEHFLTINMNLNLSDKIKLIQQSYSDCYNNDKFHYSILDSNRNVIIDYDAIDGTCYAKGTETKIINVLNDIGLTLEEKDILIESTNDIYHSDLNNELKIIKITENINTILSKFTINKKVIFSLIVLIILFFNIPNVPNTSLLISNGLNTSAEKLFYSNYTETPINNYTQQNQTNNSIQFISNYTQATTQPITQINNYNILSYVASGTYGDVYKGISPSGETVLIKKILTDKYTQKEIDNMLYLKDVCSEFFTCIKDNFTEGIYTYIVIEYLKDYISLDKIVKIDKQNFYKIIDNIKTALTTLHHLGMAHRDINPNNIIINPNTLDIKIIDFSTGCISDFECENNKRRSYMHTSAKFIQNIKYGKANLNMSEKADFYALGVIIYRIITNEYPLSNIDEMYDYSIDKNFDKIEAYLDNVSDMTKTDKIDLQYLLEGTKVFRNNFENTVDITNEELVENQIYNFNYFISETINNYIINNDYTDYIKYKLRKIDNLIYSGDSIQKGSIFYTNKNIKIGINENYLVFDTDNVKAENNIINKIIVGENIHYLKYTKYNNEYSVHMDSHDKDMKYKDLKYNELSNQIIFQKHLKLEQIDETIDNDGIIVKTFKLDLIAKIPTLTKIDIKSIQTYTGSSYEYINGILRGIDLTKLRMSKELEIIYKKHIFNIDDAFKRAPKVEIPFYVYRGTNDRSKTETPYLGIAKGYTSTSLTDDQTKDFLGPKCCMYRMKLNIGMPYLYLFEISAYKSENEILLPRNVITTLDNTYTDNNGMKTFDVTVSLSETPTEDIRVFSDQDILDMDKQEFVNNFKYMTEEQRQLFIEI